MGQGEAAMCADVCTRAPKLFQGSYLGRFSLRLLVSFLSLFSFSPFSFNRIQPTAMIFVTAQVGGALFSSFI